jgi:hypothetical protein
MVVCIRERGDTMTVQQERSTASAERTVTPVLPEQRRADHDGQASAPAPSPAPAAPQLRGWGSVEDRTMGRWIIVMAVVLGLYCSLMVTLGARVW